MISPLGRATEEEPSGSAAAVPWTATWAGEAPAADEGRAVGALGPAVADTVGVEVSVGGVELRCTWGREE